VENGEMGKRGSDAVWSGAEELRGQLRPIGELTLDPRNARRHPEPNLAAIRRSLAKWGQVKPVVVRDGTVVAGNGLVQCAESLGWSHVAAVEFQHGEADARSFGLLDNRSSELAEWDRDVLAGLLQEIESDGLELLDAGFSEADYAELLESMGRFSVEETEMPELPEGDRAPFQQMTFTLHDDQAESVKAAVAAAKAAGPFVESLNENSNGNALARIAEAYLGQG